MFAASASTSQHQATVEPFFPGVSWRAYWNLYPLFEDENNLSLVLTLDIHGIHFIVPGDLEKQG
jgi:beta-lactamase superfamily II metal-dependent hydrolase